MSSPKQIFHIISYLQYPLVLLSIVFYVPFIQSLLNNNINWDDLNYVLILFGISLSFSTLQDTSKTQNKLSKKIWESPIKGKIGLIIISLMAFSFLIMGLISLYGSTNSSFENISIGITVLGIGLIGILKSGVEMFENHRRDRQ